MSIAALLGRMTTAEKIGQLTMLAPSPAQREEGRDELEAKACAGTLGSVLNLMGRAAIDRLQRRAVNDSRLSIPLLFCHDILHGYRSLVPTPLGEAAAFDPLLWERTAALAAAEASRDGIALTFAPMIDVARDPRWGRMCEGPGEDPWMAARFAAAKVRGFQGCEDILSASDGHIAATAKHFVAYGAVRAGLDYAEVDISQRHLQEVYLPPFRAAVKAGVAALMPAFVDLGGVPMTAHRALLRDILRNQWGFDGVVISDYDAIHELIAHGVAADPTEAACLALQATVDIDMASGIYASALPDALARGLVSMADVDAAVLRVLRLKERLGLFEDPYRAAPASWRVSAILGDAPALAREAAARSFVLLRNDDALPLTDAGQRLLVISPFPDWGATMDGPWPADGRDDEVSGLLPALRAALPGTRIEGLTLPSLETSSPDLLARAGAAAAQADCILLWLGETRDMSGEATSRTSPSIPQGQQRLFFELHALGKPIIVLLATGRPLVTPEILDAAQAVLVTWFPGTQAGAALAEVLTGQRDATGRLPVSWPAAIGQIPIHYARPPSGRPASTSDPLTSRYLDAGDEPQFPFGHGLSYARFCLSPPRPSATTIQLGEELRVSVRVTNTSARTGEDTVFLFLRDEVSRRTRPRMELRGMQHIRLEAGEDGEILFTLAADDFASPGEDPASLEPGSFLVMVGHSADPARQSVVRVMIAPSAGQK